VPGGLAKRGHAPYWQGTSLRFIHNLLNLVE
jgi:hypothetical protein